MTMTDAAPAAFAVQAGTIAARALAWFSTQPPDLAASTAVVAEALDQPVRAVLEALEPVFEHGLIACERRDGLRYWSTARRPMRPLGSPPAVTADDDEPDDFPIVQRTVPATNPKESAMNKPATPPQPTKKPRAAPAVFDPASFELKKGRPLPPNRTAADSRYRALLDRLAEPGDSFDLPPAVAKGLVSAAKKAGVKLATRVLTETTTGVWRL